MVASTLQLSLHRLLSAIDSGTTYIILKSTAYCRHLPSCYCDGLKQEYIAKVMSHETSINVYPRLSVESLLTELWAKFIGPRSAVERKKRGRG